MSDATLHAAPEAEVLTDFAQETIVSTDTVLELVTDVAPALEVIETPGGDVLHDREEALSVVETALQGPPGRAGYDVAGVFILDVTGIGGIVGQKHYAEGGALVSAMSDTATVCVHVGADGVSGRYTPSVTLNDLPVDMTESSTKRWFTGSIGITIADTGVTTLTAANGLWQHQVQVQRSSAGPAVLGVVFGPYPGAQTALKAGDTIDATITTDPAAVSVTVQAAGASATAQTVPVVAGTAHATITASSALGNQVLYLSARNSLGTEGAGAVSPSLLLDQAYPTIGSVTVSYPVGQGAFGAAEAGTLSAVASNFDTIVYSSEDFAIDTATAYAATKAITATATGYVGSGANIAITATRAANGATTIRTGLAKLATTAPTAAITIAGNPPRLASSPAGQDYTVRITPTQDLAAAPDLTASHGTWQGAWTLAAGAWTRALRIDDTTPRGAATFSGLSMTGLSGIAGSTITSGASYTVGGMTQRAVTFDPFSRVAYLGAPVGDQTKTSASIVGGAALTRYTDSTPRAGGYFIADQTGAYTPTGSYLALSDTALAASNTSGTLQATFQESA